ncbi:Hypothetical protein ORPV_379 [Orpheovirus IHUMI-LCC2]|uniref:Uncharacterized protein n=1 Tax=Orpheovirus IHUMI-LCC2 TaxID=2023057 RepID=A0A2I2L432_9VIRU|nr:Hypothetical protein ORPV_379 [Orpheovirus IHUMI-LCC2]SNW62283.1 Hypothetical protein ORPV_379 [Orpheovirus IHUMI-LCC2]
MDQRDTLISEFVLSYKKIRKLGNRFSLKILESMCFEIEDKIKEFKITKEEVQLLNNHNISNEDILKFIEAFNPYLL